MQSIRKRLSFANIMSAAAVFIALSGIAVAAGLPKNSVGKKQLKNNAVTTAKIKKNAVTSNKIKKSAVTSAKVKDQSLTGTDINLGTLGTVPSATNATNATTAANLTGQTTFAVRLGFGQTQTVASHGSVSFEASCRRDGGTDYAEVLYQTSVNGAVAGGDEDYEGEGDFLNVGTDFEDRRLAYESDSEGDIQVYADIDEGFVLGADGKGLVANSEGIILGLNYGGPGCYIAGVVNAVG